MIRFARKCKSKFINHQNVSYLLKKYKGSVMGADIQIQHPECIYLGQNVVLGDNTKLLCTTSYNSEIFNPSPQIILGDRFHCTRNLTIQCCNSVYIENDVTIASDVFIIDYNHGFSPLTKNYLENNLSISSGVKISNGVWIGNQCIILGGVHIGEKTIVGAGSVVTKSFPSYCIIAGNPARIIKKYDFNTNSWI